MKTLFGLVVIALMVVLTLAGLTFGAPIAGIVAVIFGGSGLGIYLIDADQREDARKTNAQQP